jgi:Cu(I)/Ag(I) efflux system membrane fusion protein
MNSLIKLTFLIFLLALVGAGSFFWGKRQLVPTAVVSAPAERKILYYRNPMGLADTSPVPKLDSMGMDYVPVYAGDEADTSSVALSAEKVQLLGVQTSAVQRRSLSRTLRASGVIELDERKQQWVAPRFEGWIQQLQVNTTGQRVSKGQALFTVYSPALDSAVREVQLAHTAGLVEVEKSARGRLENWQIAEQDWAQLQQDRAHLVFRAPIDGVVIEKLAVEGARFAAGEVLFKLLDLSTVWLQAEVAEQDQGSLRIGQVVTVKIDAYPATQFSGKVSFIAPLLNEKTRTVRVRIELPNPDLRLRLGMYASVSIADKLPAALSVPLSAVIDSGTQQTVLVQVAAGRFQPRVVQLGARNDEYVTVLDGLALGEKVVNRANFLIDAESNLRAALGGMQAPSAVSPAHSGGN